MNPRLSCAATVVLPSFSPSSKPSLTASSPVPSARTTSSRGITWAGLKKWSPRKRSGREVAAACSATDSDEVLVAKRGPLLDHAVHLLPHLELQVQVLGDRLDHEVAVGEVRVVERGLDAASHRVGVALLRLALLDRAGELLLDLADAAVELLLAHLAHHDVPARLGADLGDPVAHQAAAEDTNLADLHDGAAAYTGRRRDRPARSGEDRLALLALVHRRAQLGQLVDRQVDLVGQPVDLGKRLGDRRRGRRTRPPPPWSRRSTARGARGSGRRDRPRPAGIRACTAARAAPGCWTR